MNRLKRIAKTRVSTSTNISSTKLVLELQKNLQQVANEGDMPPRRAGQTVRAPRSFVANRGALVCPGRGGGFGAAPHPTANSQQPKGRKRPKAAPRAVAQPPSRGAEVSSKTVCKCVIGAYYNQTGGKSMTWGALPPPPPQLSKKDRIKPPRPQRGP